MTVRRNIVEPAAWIIALIALAVYYPSDSHVTLCPLANLGFEFCPGCGLGRSISYAFHGEWENSFSTHPLGIFAIVVLTSRIITIITNKPILSWLK